MATKKKAAPVELPKVGDVYAVKLKGGFWGLCWVARRGRPAPGSGFAHLGPYVVVASVDWFGRAPPKSLGEEALRILIKPNVLRITHDGDDQRAVWTIHEALSPNFELVGQLPKAPLAGFAPFISSWSRMADAMDKQRVWNEAPAASAAALAARSAKLAGKNERLQGAQQKALTAKRKALTFKELRKTKLLRAWDGAMPAARVTEGRAMLISLLDALEAQVNPVKRRAALRASVTAMNRWNDKHGVIETSEREALFESLVDIASAAGLLDARSIIEEERDW
jgi:hypothetical protein